MYVYPLMFASYQDVETILITLLELTQECSEKGFLEEYPIAKKNSKAMTLQNQLFNAYTHMHLYTI